MTHKKGCTCGFCGYETVEEIAARLLKDCDSRAGARWVAIRFANRMEQDGHLCAATEYRQVVAELEAVRV